VNAHWSSGRSGWGATLLAVLTGCASYDPNGAPSASDSDFAQEMSEAVLGTESGNPSEPSDELGTESGNPGMPTQGLDHDPAPAQDLGTESGNPTRPPPPASTTEGTPEPVSVPVCVPVPNLEGVPEPDDQESNPATDVGGSTEPDAPDAVDPGTEPLTPMAAPDGSMTPGVASPGPICEPYACQALAEATAASFGTGLPAPEPFDSTICSEADSCQCSTVSGSATVVTARADADPCLVDGRFGCLYSTDQFPGCDSAVANSCEVVCSDVQEALAADATGLSVQVRASACTDLGCRYVLQSGEQCSVSGDALVPAPSDCAATDDELLVSR
jgi:hypothetical protein